MSADHVETLAHFGNTVSSQAVAEDKQQQQEDLRTVEAIPGGVLKALHAHTAAERGRYSLNCTHAEGREVIGANGAVLARVILPEDMGPENLYELPKPHLRKRKPATLIRQNGSCGPSRRTAPPRPSRPVVRRKTTPGGLSILARRNPRTACARTCPDASARPQDAPPAPQPHPLS